MLQGNMHFTIENISSGDPKNILIPGNGYIDILPKKDIPNLIYTPYTYLSLQLYVLISWLPLFFIENKSTSTI